MFNDLQISSESQNGLFEKRTLVELDEASMMAIDGGTTLPCVVYYTAMSSVPCGEAVVIAVTIVGSGTLK